MYRPPFASYASIYDVRKKNVPSFKWWTTLYWYTNIHVSCTILKIRNFSIIYRKLQYVVCLHSFSLINFIQVYFNAVSLSLHLIFPICNSFQFICMFVCLYRFFIYIIVSKIYMYVFNFRICIRHYKKYSYNIYNRIYTLNTRYITIYVYNRKNVLNIHFENIWDIHP